MVRVPFVEARRVVDEAEEKINRELAIATAWVTDSVEKDQRRGATDPEGRGAEFCFCLERWMARMIVLNEIAGFEFPFFIFSFSAGRAKLAGKGLRQLRCSSRIWAMATLTPRRASGNLVRH